MKFRIVVILSITVILISLVVAEQIFITNTLSFMQQESEVLKQEIFNQNDVNSSFLIEKIDFLDKSWAKRENILCLLVNHKDMEKVGEQIKKLQVLINQNSKKEAEYEIQLLCYYIDSYEHFISLNFQNIF